MKKSHTTLMGIAALSLLTACTGKNANEATTSAAQPDAAVTTVPYVTEEGDLQCYAWTTADEKIIWIKDNDGTRMNPCQLFSDAPDSLFAQMGLTEGIPSSVSYVLLETEGKRILFDAGLGPKMGGHIAERLATLQLTPDSIDMLYLTHLHPDHIGGMMGDEGPLFPNAQVYVGDVEYDAWMNQMTPEQAGLQQGVMAAYASQIHQFAFGDTLPCGVVAMDAVGHTPGHTVFQHGQLLIIGDLMHGYALQQEHPEVNANFDMDKAKAAESRKRILDYARQNGLTMLGMHQPEPAL